MPVIRRQAELGLKGMRRTKLMRHFNGSPAMTFLPDPIAKITDKLEANQAVNRSFKKKYKKKKRED